MKHKEFSVFATLISNPQDPQWQKSAGGMSIGNLGKGGDPGRVQNVPVNQCDDDSDHREGEKG